MHYLDFEKYLVELLNDKVLTSFEIIKATKEKFPDVNVSTVKSWILRSPILISSKPIYFDHCSYGYTLKNNKNSAELISNYKRTKNNSLSVLKTVFAKRNFLTAHTFCKICNIANIDEIVINKKIKILNKIIRKGDIWFDGKYIIRGNIKIIPNVLSDFFADIRNKLFINKLIAFKQNNENLININFSNFYGADNNQLFIPKTLYNIRVDGYAKSLSFVANDKRRSYAVYDFAVLDKYTIEEAKIFLNKVYKLRAYKLLILPFCIFKEADDDVLSFLRKNGLISIKYNDYLGSKYGKFVSSLQSIVEGRNDLIQKVDEIKELSNGLKEIGIFEQTKGYLFEYTMYRLLNDFYRTKPDRNIKFGKGKNSAQFDMIVKTNYEEIICECKCNNEKIGFGTLERGNINTIAHTIKKMELYNSLTNKKLLYICTTGFKKITKDNEKIITTLCPSVSPSNSGSLFDLDSAKEEIKNNEWFILSNELFASNN